MDKDRITIPAGQTIPTKALLPGEIKAAPITFQQLLAKHIQDPTLQAAVSPETLGYLLMTLEDLPKDLYGWGKALDSTNDSIVAANKQLNIARHNLSVAEATAIAFPDRPLKNAEERKAYVTEKTEPEQRIIIDYQNDILDLETVKAEQEREYNLVNDRLQGAKYRARLISALLQYLGR